MTQPRANIWVKVQTFPTNVGATRIWWLTKCSTAMPPRMMMSRTITSAVNQTRDAPAVGAPIDQREGDDAGEQQCLVGERVDDGAELRALIEAAGDEAVEAVGDGGDDEGGQRGDAQAFIGGPCGDAGPVVDSKHREHRNQQDPRQGDATGQGHT